MDVRDDGTSVLLGTRTGFEAETIAAALRARGLNAQTIDTAGAEVWSGSITQAKVVVPRHELELAQQTLEVIRHEFREINWDEVDVGEGDGSARPNPFPRSRWWAWTVVLVMVPVGFIVLSLGTQYPNPTVQLVGGAVLMAAAVMGLFMLMPEKR